MRRKNADSKKDVAFRLHLVVVYQKLVKIILE